MYPLPTMIQRIRAQSLPSVASPRYDHFSGAVVFIGLLRAWPASPARRNLRMPRTRPSAISSRRRPIRPGTTRSGSAVRGSAPRSSASSGPRPASCCRERDHALLARRHAGRDRDDDRGDRRSRADPVARDLDRALGGACAAARPCAIRAAGRFAPMTPGLALAAGAVPAELVPLVLRRDQRFAGTVFLPARGFVTATGRIDAGRAGPAGRAPDPRPAVRSSRPRSISIAMAPPPRIVDGEGVIALRATRALALASYPLADLIAATSVPITGSRPAGRATRSGSTPRSRFPRCPVRSRAARAASSCRRGYPARCHPVRAGSDRRHEIRRSSPPCARASRPISAPGRPRRAMPRSRPPGTARRSPSPTRARHRARRSRRASSPACASTASAWSAIAGRSAGPASLDRGRCRVRRPRPRAAISSGSRSTMPTMPGSVAGEAAPRAGACAASCASELPRVQTCRRPGHATAVAGRVRAPISTARQAQGAMDRGLVELVADQHELGAPRRGAPRRSR